MKNIGIIIIFYNIIALSIINSNWIRVKETYFGFTAERWQFIDFCDIPLYIGLAVVTFKYRKLKYWQLYPIIGCWLLLCLKVIELYKSFESYIFWNWVFIALVPILIIDERYNK